MTAGAVYDIDVDAERARRQHIRGVVLVFALWLPIFFWLAHLASMAALVGYVANNREKWWIFWIDTGLCAAGTIACMVVAVVVGVSVGAHEDDGSPEGRTRFLAWQALLAGFANLALILAEGSYVAFISVGHR
jgi:hypothetical protein